MRCSFSTRRRFSNHTGGPRPLRGYDDHDCRVPDGTLGAGEEVLARRYRSILDSRQVVDLDAAIAESAARMRSLFRPKFADAVQVASAIVINADVLVTHDRDFSSVTGLRVIS